MSEQVIRHRGPGRDEDGKIIPAIDAPLSAIAIAPTGGGRNVQRARDGRTVSCTAYFVPRVDIANGDELTVRGERYSIIVNDWRSPRSGRGGIEVLCLRGEG